MSIPFPDVNLGSPESSAELASRAGKNTAHRGKREMADLANARSVQTSQPDVKATVEVEVPSPTPQRGGRG